MNTEKRDYFYEYILYFWKKKWLIIGIPVIVAILAFAASQLLAKGYEGTATYYAASPKVNYLDDPELIQAEYGDKYGMKVEPTESKKVKFTVEGKDRKTVQDVLTKGTNAYEKALMDNYNSRLESTQKYKDIYEKRLATIEKTFQIQNDLQANKGLSWQEENASKLAEGVSINNDTVTNLQDTVKGMETDLFFFKKDKPRLMSKEITKQSNHAKANTIIGFVFALFLTLLGLMLSKYIGDARAREERRHD
ncbi:hypothetical protein LRR81_09500 [Metabacillus sp. GX 13764]|uniref:hypothetical protein n=1 Tax=Metabacillus kandeliae TaxID=2900151 RepID=UPI001E4BE2FC|nr:hypothetical protein [Metabacillus kandeliae]MCD7034472.1 hypothetical protein [Metabacillus kandeliae]